MKILCTHPGRYGDLLWALPTVRALSHNANVPVDLLLGPTYADPSFCSLLSRQIYIGQVLVAHDWEIHETAPITPREPPTLPSGYDIVLHLAYDGWPKLSLPYETYRIAEDQLPLTMPLALDPWLAPPFQMPTSRIVVGFSDEHFELKYGLYWLLRQHFVQEDSPPASDVLNVSGGPRWKPYGYTCDWESAAGWIATASVFVGCCSALHVLACALGTPVVMIEPNTMRHHDVFYPYGKASDQVWLVLGLDGQPTFDSRHLVDVVRERLAVLA